jgi:hypothetical protein
VYNSVTTGVKKQARHLKPKSDNVNQIFQAMF